MSIRTTISSLLHYDGLLHKSVAVVLLSWVVTLAPLNVEFLAPIELAIRDLEYSDIVLSQLQAETPTRLDTSIVLVNVGLASRSELALTIDRLRDAGAACIGVDVMFTSPVDTLGASLLRDAVSRTQQIVMAEVLSDRVDEEEDAGRPFRQRERGVLQGLPDSVFANVNLPASETYKTVRYWDPSVQYAGVESPSLVKRMYEMMSNQLHPALLEEASLFVKYQRQRTWYTLEWSECIIPDRDLSMVNGRAVLLGFLGRSLGDTMSLEDRFFTPQNKTYVGRAWPDMYGVEIHATVLSMLLHQDVVREPSQWVDALIAFVLTALIIAVNGRLSQRMISFGEATTRIVQVIILSIVFGVMALLLLDYSVLMPIDISVACTVFVLDIATVYDGLVTPLYRRIARIWRLMRIRRYKRLRITHIHVTGQQ